MKRRLCAAALAACALTVSFAQAQPPAAASPAPSAPDEAASDPPAAAPERASKLFAEAALGPGLFHATSGQDGDQRTFSGTSAELTLAIGSKICNVAIGGAYLRDHIFTVSAEDEVIDGDEPDLEDVEMTFTQFGIFLDAHLTAEPGPRVQAMFALASLGVLDDRDQDIDQPNGTSYSLAAGYDFRIGSRAALGALLRLSYASLHVEEQNGTDVSVLLPSLALTATLL